MEVDVDENDDYNHDDHDNEDDDNDHDNHNDNKTNDKDEEEVDEEESRQSVLTEKQISMPLWSMLRNPPPSANPGPVISPLPVPRL